MTKFSVGDILKDKLSKDEIIFQINDVDNIDYHFTYICDVGNYIKKGQIGKFSINAIDQNSVLYKSEEIKPVDNSTCKHENKYFNVLSANLKFWVCPDCKKELKF